MPSTTSSGTSRPEKKDKLWIDTDVAGLDYATLEEEEEDLFTEVAVSFDNNVITI